MTHAEVTAWIDVPVTARCWRSGSFPEDFAGLSGQDAASLAETGVRTAGLGYLPAGRYHADGTEIHKNLLQAGAWIIEGPGLSASPAAGTR